MGRIVYADVLFLINSSMDFLVFYICARFSGKKLGVVRSAVAAAIGGVYGIAALFIPGEGLVPALCDMAALLIVCAVGFYKPGDRLRDFLARSALFAGVCAILGGVMTAFYSLLNRSDISVLEGESGDDISVWLFALLAAAGGAAAFAGGRRMRRLASSRQGDIEIVFESKSVRLRAMTDTGNMLSDPLSGRGVLICELDAVRSVFPKELVEYWRSGNIGASSSLPEEYAAKLRFIPARGAVGSRTTLLSAIIPESVTVVGKREVDLLVAPVPYKLSAGESRALLPPGII